MPKKIGILTFHWSDNYGAVLQAYALQAYVINLGIDCEIIDYCPPKINLARRIISKSPVNQIEKILLYRKHVKFQKFRKRYLKLSSKSVFSLSDLDIVTLGRYSDVIVGSDQVWNPTFHASVRNFFEVYMLEHFSSCNTIAYAPSIGHVSSVTIPVKYQKLITKYISNINHISVREHTSIQLLKALSIKKPIQHVCDPTILLDTNYFPFNDSKKCSDKYLFSYILHSADQDFLKLNHLISSTINCKIINCNAKDSFLSNYVLPAPEEWLSLIRGAEFLTTNSFHGVLFAIKFSTPFICLKRSDSQSPMNTRLESLLSLLGLKERIITSEIPVRLNLIKSTIDWDLVHDKLLKFRDKSSEFLVHALQI